MMSAVGTKDRDLSEAQVAELIRTQFPHVVPRSVVFLKAGYDSEAFEVNGELIFRFPKRAEVQTFLDNELRLLPKIAPVLPVPIPHFEFIGQGSEIFPYRFAGYRKLLGTFARGATLAEASENALAGDLADFLTVLHGYSYNDLPISEESGENAEEWIEEVLTLLENLQEELGRQKYANCRSFIESTAARVLPYSGAPKLIHADLLSEHILLTPSGRLAGVIDWGDVRRGDPALDFAGLLHWRGKKFVQRVLDNYQGDKDPMLLSRAALFATSAGLDDVLWGTQENLPEYVTSGHQALNNAL